MKRIYTFTLSSDDVPSSGRMFGDHLRLFAYMLYNEIYNYYGENDVILNFNDKIVYNDINEKIDGYKYRLDSDLSDNGYTYYEPFIVGVNTLGFTIVDENFDENKLREVVGYVLTLLNFKYDVIIKGFDYEAKNINDERYRDDALRLVFETLGYKFTRKCSLASNARSFYNKKKSRKRVRTCYS